MEENTYELIERLCPEGVEYRRLGEVATYIRGLTYSKGKEVQEDTPLAHKVLRANNITLNTNTINLDDVKFISPEVKVKDSLYLKTHDILICAGSGSKSHIGKVAYIYEDMNYTFGGFMGVIRTEKEFLNSRFLFHILTSTFFKNYLSTSLNSSTINNLNSELVNYFEIPVPPMEVQQEVVRILDKFTALQAELQAELQARKKQYEYYRDKLLTFAHDDPKIVWKKLGEVCEMRNGYTPSKNNSEFWEKGTIPWFRMEDIRQNGRILSDSIQHITPSAIKGKGLFEANTFILATTATIGEHALIIADSLANQRFANLKIRKSLDYEIDVKFFYYYMFIIDDWCKKNTNAGGFACVDMKKLKDFEIPIPPLSRQKEIVEILDKFEALTSDLQRGLPAEIEARRKQYEYYRDKLLNFKRLVQGDCQSSWQ